MVFHPQLLQVHGNKNTRKIKKKQSRYHSEKQNENFVFVLVFSFRILTYLFLAGRKIYIFENGSDTFRKPNSFEMRRKLFQII